jgi:hypothetical protein
VTSDQESEVRGSHPPKTAASGAAFEVSNYFVRKRGRNQPRQFQPRDETIACLSRLSEMKLDRYFYSVSAVVFVLITFWGFHSFYLYGKAAGDNPIAPEIFVLDSIHGAVMSAWILLFLTQAMLIGVRNRRRHMKLGLGCPGKRSRPGRLRRCHCLPLRPVVPRFLLLRHTLPAIPPGHVRSRQSGHDRRVLNRQTAGTSTRFAN